MSKFLQDLEPEINYKCIWVNVNARGHTGTFSQQALSTSVLYVDHRERFGLKCLCIAAVLFALLHCSHRYRTAFSTSCTALHNF